MEGINIFTLQMFAGETNNSCQGTNKDYLLKCLGNICYCMQIQCLTSITDSCDQMRNRGFYMRSKIQIKQLQHRLLIPAKLII